jgi:methylmalonyl-CoA epimerase
VHTADVEGAQLQHGVIAGRVPVPEDRAAERDDDGDEEDQRGRGCSLLRPSHSIDPTIRGMLLTEIDHVAIAVRDLEAAIDYYNETFGCEVEHREIVERDGVEEALLKVADSYIQLLTPSRPDSTVAKYLEKNGEGIHHVGYRVDDCAAALEAVKANGHRVIDEQPRPGSRGTTVAFIHPKTAFGTLIELVQE